MTSLYDLNAHLNLGNPRPPGALPATIKTRFVHPVRPHKRQRLHIPAFAVTANVDGRTVLAARFLCGDASHNVRAVEDTLDLDPCPRCVMAAAPARFDVYAYYDATDTALYIGQTNNLAARRKAHARTSKWHARAARFALLSSHTTRDEALAAEAKAIATLAPTSNIQHPAVRS